MGTVKVKRGSVADSRRKEPGGLKKGTGCGTTPLRGAVQGYVAAHNDPPKQHLTQKNEFKERGRKQSRQTKGSTSSGGGATVE